MSNPFTDTLVKQVKNKRIAVFVATWDRLEALVIRVYKSKAASQEDEREWSHIHNELIKEYPRRKDALHPFWQDATIGGERAKDDPFDRLLATSNAHSFVGNWLAMQTLPAARQAINQWLVDLINKQHQR
jgi:hypothetical protein